MLVESSYTIVILLPRAPVLIVSTPVCGSADTCRHRHRSGVTSDRALTGGDRMTYLDSAVLNLTERMCRRFQTWTGRTNVWLAFQLTNLSIVVYFIWVAGVYLLSVDLALRVFVTLFCGGLFL